MGELGATCFHTLTDAHRDIPEDEWDAERLGYLCMSPDAYAELKTALHQLCYKNKRCSYEAKEAIRNFTNRVDVFHTNAIATTRDTEHPLD